MKAFVSVAGDDGVVAELELAGPLAKMLEPIGRHLSAAARRTLEHIARIDRDRARGKHELAFGELLELVAAAHALLADPPGAVRKFRRIPDGEPYPTAERVGDLLAWLRDRRGCACVHYDLWASSGTPN
ncbi:MAG: hypothetical protein KF773_11260 [Deltaproteobacteria bacterium]|nr:hypothetical protein [Deltaproteobacteria bacterium]MCW5803153.1 hypothetical protein [Deltaproteobacteria bacterium]